MGYGGYGNEINPRMWEDSDDENWKIIYKLLKMLIIIKSLIKR
jgi:hypothetical protein